MNCEKCGKNLLETIDYCPTCKINEQKKSGKEITNYISEEVKVDVDNEEDITESTEEIILPKKNRNKSSIISFCLALIPYMLIVYCIIVSGGSTDESGNGAVWWLLIMYYWSIGFPILFASIILAIRGWKSDKKIFSYISQALNIIPFLLLFFTILAPFFYS